MSITSVIVGRIRANFAGVSQGKKPFLSDLAVYLSFLTALFFTAPTLAATSSVGATAGSFRVSESGAATYSIPIAVPPGPAGMQPSMSLNYSSQGGNGLLGMGWSLGGLSVIHPCSKTIAQDGVNGSVNFDANDRFCIDGQRLVAISGSYGAPNTEYRTETESYSRIISYGTTGMGPTSFKVWTKSGQIMEYGNSADSRIQPQGQATAMLWALNKVSDTVGNYLTVTYIQDQPNGQFYPTRIDYAGNSNTGKAPGNSVQFSYETRPDILPDSYIDTALIKNTVRLTKIQSFAATALVHEYRTGYDNSGPSNITLLANITECAGDGVCLAPTAFGWQKSQGSLQMAATAWAFPAGSEALWGGGNTSGPLANNMPLADVNGDGRGDYVYPSSGLVYAMLSNGKGFASPIQWGTGYVDGYPNMLADVNGDGKADFVYVKNGVAYVQLSTGTSFSPAVVWASGITLDPNSWMPAWLADVNGDGKADLIYAGTGGNVYVGLSTGSGFSAPALWATGIPAGGYGNIDINSSGAMADVDGDGKADFIYKQADTVYVRLSNGTGFDPAISWFNNFPTSASSVNLSKLADVDGDARADLIIGYPDFTRAVALSNGRGFSVPVSLGVGFGQYGLSTNRMGDIDGDGRADLIYAPMSYGVTVNLTTAPTPNRITTITNGLGATTNIGFKPVTDGSVYTPDADAVYPVQDIRAQGPLYIVSNVTNSDGVGGNYAMAYTYVGAKTHLQGGGFLGFRQFIVHDTQIEIKTTTTFRQNYPFQGMPLSVEKRTDAGVLLNQITNIYNDTVFNGIYHQSLLSNSVESSYELNGGLVTTMTTNTQYDAYGNPTQIVTGTGNGYSKTTNNTTNNTYTNDTPNWLLGRLTIASVTSATPNAGTLTRTSSFAYNPANGLLTQEVIEPNNVAYRVQTDYSYDAYGNKTTVTVSGANIATRTTATVFDTKGQFPIKTTNALNQSDNGAYDGRFGVATSLTGPNGLTTTWSYDSFGRKVNETRADATQTNIAYNVCDATCPSLAKYYIVTIPSGAPTSYVYYDMLNREIRAQVQGFDGRLITKDTQYDSLGRVSQTSLPYYAGDTVYWTRVTYDQLNRPIQETRPDGSTNQTTYNGLTTVSTNALGQTQTKAKNSQGQLVSVTDTQGNVVSYQYDAFGNLTKTTDAKGNVVVLTYDLRGRKIAMSDPDMGYWTYQYNVLGQLVKQTDAKGQVVTMSYDILGRMLSRNEPDLISNWTYDTMAKGIGKLAQVNSDNGAQRLYFYDTYGRVMRESNRIDTWYNFDTAYDVYGRVSKITYPTGFAVIHIYNAYGYLAEVRNSANNALLWKANAKDAQGRVLNETLGNGLNTVRSYTATTGRIATIAVGPNSTATIQNQTFYFDSLGNLTYRYDPIQGQSETFVYDNLNRLTTATSASGTVSLTYDAIGNITSKNDAGAYTYGAKPHAVAQVSGPLNAAYSYDANGNMAGGNGRTVTHTSYNAPSQIVTSSAVVSFLYDADHARIRQITTRETMIYFNPRIDVGAHFEKEIKNGVTTYQHYLYGSAGVIGIYSTTSTTASTRYFHTDHLGSIVAVTDDSAKVLARYKFDAWGKRISLAGSPDTTHHGFTGHEHLDEVGLIHMNGRVYDPVLGRFMSADPYIQAPDNLQSYNRYSYVWNNSLGYTDPTGFSAWTKFRDKILKPVVAVVVAWYVGPAVFNAVLPSAVGAAGATGMGMTGSLWTGSAIAGAASGAAVGGIVGGIYNGPQGIAQGAKYGAIGGAITGPVAAMYGGINGQGGSPWGWDRVAAQSASGGLASAAQGGSFADGFRGSAIGSAFRYVYNSVVKYDVDPWAGGDAVRKEEFDMPVKGANNFGTAGELNPKSWFGEGGVLSSIANQIASMNAIAGMHDVFQVRLQEWGGVWARNILNVPGMLPAAGITWIGLRDTPYLTYDTIQRTERRAK